MNTPQSLAANGTRVTRSEPVVWWRHDSFDGRTRNPSTRGQFFLLRSKDGLPLNAYCYQPPKSRRPTGLLISVHGVSRNAWEHVRKWAPFAGKFGFQVLAPVFSRQHYAGYQRLAASRDGADPARQLLELLAILKLDGWLCSGPVILFGFSAGAQFAHRFLMAYPGVAHGAILASAGWWTFPDVARPFPSGIGNPSDASGIQVRLQDFLRLPILITVGSRDVYRDKQLRHDPKIDAEQGFNRLERAIRWFDALGVAAKAQGVRADLRFQVVPNASHSFAECMIAGLDKIGIEFAAAVRNARSNEDILNRSRRG
jgi:pimeloyl-ACP methyl ester carboxylesterase